MTPTQLIAAVRAWSAHVITQPDDPMRAKVDAVLAMAECTALDLWLAASTPTPGSSQSWVIKHELAQDKLRTAFIAAGLGGSVEGT